MSANWDPEEMRTPPQTEDSLERGWVEEGHDSPDPESYDDLGNSEELDDESDIADEGPGHRG
jgi:hypothetical protein